MRFSLLATAVALQGMWVAAEDPPIYTNETDPYQGLSPPVYPSPPGTGTGKWAKAYERARALTSQMTIEELVNSTFGVDGSCVGNSGAVPRLGITPLCFSDAPAGVRGQEFVSSFPAGVTVAATFDRDLMYSYGAALGNEFKGKGIHVALGPVAGPLGRLARGGRNWEGLSADPYAAGVGMAQIVRGMQEGAGVIATAKHFLVNEQEWRRRPGFPEALGVDNEAGPSWGEAMSSNVDDRTLRELYAFPFAEGLREGNVAAVMCSYQRVNNSYACQNSALLNGILKTEMGFQGFVVSDWDGQHAGYDSANAGLDLAMPSGLFWGDGKLLDAVKNGSVSHERVTDMADRMLAARFLLGMGIDEDTFPPTAVHDNLELRDPVNVQDDHADLIRTIASAGTVLVKNTNGALPLKNPQYVTVYGYDAGLPSAPWEDATRFGGGYSVNKNWTVFESGTLVVAGGSGGNTPPYVVTPFDAIRERVAQDKGNMRWDLSSDLPSPAYVNSDACLVFINAYGSESFDRHSLVHKKSDDLVNWVARNCTNTIVVMHTAGIRLVDPWIENPNVTAVLYALLPGQESGHSIVDVLWGDAEPAGRLPFTVAKEEKDYGHLLNSTVDTSTFPQSDFTEGLYIDYRAFQRNGTEPRYPFGYGLSYAGEFGYGNIAVSKNDSSDTAEYPDPDVAIVQGGHPMLWDVVAEVTAEVSLSGNSTRKGSEVAQLYVAVPGAGEDTPAKQMRGFQKVKDVCAGETRKVTFQLTRRDLSIWDVEAQQWRLRRGEYGVFVGSNSRDLPIQTSFEL